MGVDKRSMMFLLPVMAAVSATPPMCFKCSGTQTADCGYLTRCGANEEVTSVLKQLPETRLPTKLHQRLVLKRAFDVASLAPLPREDGTRVIVGDSLLGLDNFDVFFLQTCYTQKYVTSSGSFLFRSGCEKKSICNTISKRSKPLIGSPVVCEACCDGDMCVRYHCGSRAYAFNHGQLCYTCSAIADPRNCKTASYCSYNEKCLTYRYRMPFDNQIMYSQECSSEKRCSALAAAALAIARRGEKWYNQTCCDGNFCNDGLAQMGVAAL